MRISRSLIVDLIGLIILLFSLTGILNATTLTVNELGDAGDGVCDSTCTLRDAVDEANFNYPGPDIIVFSSLFDSTQMIQLDASLRFTQSGEDVEIRGPGSNKLTISGDLVDKERVFEIIDNFVPTILILRDLRVVNGRDSIQGGAIINEGDLRIFNCVFENNFTDPTEDRVTFGGAIVSTVKLEIYNSAFTNNSTVFSSGSFNNMGIGGAIYATRNVTISDSTFNDNSALNGSAIYGYDPNLNADISNSTFSGNTSSTGSTVFVAEAFTNPNVLHLNSVTIAGNTVGTQAVDADANLTTTEIRNSIVSLNSSGDLGGTVVQTGPNLIGGTPMLGALAFNGGLTQTHALLPGSPAIDAAMTATAPATDQRGGSRPQGTAADLGAFESGVTVTAVNTPQGMNVSTTLTSASVTFSDVSQAGTTTQIPISPSNAGTLPGGYSLGSGFPAFEITTTAAYTPPITVCIQVDPLTTLAVFNALRIMHNESGVLIDKTILPPGSPAPDFATKTICARVTSLSPFVVAQNLAPTSANVSIAGRVFRNNGRGIARAYISMVGQNGETRTAVSNNFGYYSFENVPVGTYLVSIEAKESGFATQLINISDSIRNLDFFPIDSGTFQRFK